LRIGSVGETAVTVGERSWSSRTASPQERAGVLFQNTTVDVALLETNPRELVRAGFGNDRCDVALFPSAQAGAGSEADEWGREPSEFVRALRNALAPEGAFVLAAEHEWGIEPELPPARIVLVAHQGDSPRVRDHLAADGRALLVQGENFVLMHGAQPPRVLGKRPCNLTDRDAHGLLAALAAGLVLGQTAEALGAYLCALP
jgi:hypothetical protein